MIDWEPIETAPKDGTAVLLASVEPRGTVAIIECSWWSAERCAKAEGGEPEDYEADWYQVYDSHLSFCRPTHWRPALVHPRDAIPHPPAERRL